MALLPRLLPLLGGKGAGAPSPLRRALLAGALLPRPAAAEPQLQYPDPLFSRLRARYFLLRPGETTFEASGLVDSNPINKATSDRGLTPRGQEQVRRSAEALRAMGVQPVVFYDTGARASQTADILAQALAIPRARLEPEFRWLEARGLGALDQPPQPTPFRHN